MDADEWTRWRAFDLMYGVEDETPQLLAILCSFVHSQIVDRDKTEAKSPADFLPRIGTRQATFDEVVSGGIRIEPRLRARLDGAE
jgi:hypothetical protein